MICIEINVNKVLYKILTTKNCDSKSMTFLFKIIINKGGQIGGLTRFVPLVARQVVTPNIN